jgi:hypothetical protein
MKWRTLVSASAWVLSGVCLFLALSTPFLATSSAQPAASSELPADLAAVPKDALAFVHLRMADLWTTPTAQFVQRQLDPKLLESANRNLERITGLSLAEIDRVTLVVLAQRLPQPPEPYVIVQTLRPVNRERILQTMLPGAQQDSGTGMFYVQGREGPAVRFLTDRILVIGSQEGIRLQAVKPVRADGPLALSLKEAAGNHHLVAGVHLSREVSGQLRTMMLGQPPALPTLWGSTLSWAFDLIQGTIVVDVGYTTTCRSEFIFGGEWQAKRAFRAINGAILFMQGCCASGQLVWKETRHLAQFLSVIEQSLDTAVVEVQGNTVRSMVTAKFAPATFDQAILEFCQVIWLPGGSGSALLGTENLKLLGVAMQAYHKDFQKLPCHAIYSSDGKPLLSWRVALLPYLGHDALYRQFRLDEPWNSVQNRQLLAQMPKVFELPGAPAPEGYTYYQVVVTPADQKSIYKTIFPMISQGQMSLPQIASADGLDKTILLLEADKPVPWTAPEDVVMPPDDRPLPRFGADPKLGWFTACFADGSVRILRKNIPQDTYQRLLRQLLGVVDGQLADTTVILEPPEFRLQRGVVTPGAGDASLPVVPAGGIPAGGIPAGGIPAGNVPPGTNPGVLPPTGTGPMPPSGTRPLPPRGTGPVTPTRPLPPTRPSQPGNTPGSR